MATTSKRPDPTIVVGAVFVFSGIALLAASRGVGIAMIVLGGVLIAAGVIAARKAASTDEN
jgi:drug/metabolite transporter (DMT)-like permease